MFDKKTANRNLSAIDLRTLTTKCIIGIVKSERLRKQKVLAELKLFIDIKNAAYTAHLKDSIDYVKVLGLVKYILDAGEFYLLESAGETIVRTILNLFSNQLKELELTLRKPEIIIHGANPALQIGVRRTRQKLKSTRQSWGKIETLFSTSNSHFFKITLNPGKILTITQGKKQSEMEFIWDKGLSVNGKKLNAGFVCFWPAAQERTYSNNSKEKKSFLCCIRESEGFVSRLKKTPAAKRTPGKVLHYDYFLGHPVNYIVE